MKVNRLVLLAPIVAAVALAGCELSLRAGQACPCAEGWICCTGSNVCVHDQTECAAHSDGGHRNRSGCADPEFLFKGLDELRELQHRQRFDRRENAL